MKGDKVFLNELTPNSKGYKVQVKVIEKGRPKTSPVKKLVYQNLLLEDEKGNKMRGALFGEQVEGFKEAIVYNGVYEITNAPIKKCSEEWKSSSDELDFQMSFGRQTVIEPVPSELDSMIPTYLCIAHIPKAGNPLEKYDIFGVVLFVEEEARTVMTIHKREILVREIVIADHRKILYHNKAYECSTNMPLTISAWNDLAGDECDTLASWTGRFVVVGFTALKVTNHKGFSLATTMSTAIVKEPTGDKAKALTEWASHHQDDLTYMQSRILDVRNPSQGCVVTTIYALKLKKVADTMLEERRWLRVKVLESDLDSVHVYMGCSNCSLRTDTPLGVAYTCVGCNKDGCISSARVTFHCDIVDATGSLQVTMFTRECEKLFRAPATAISYMKQSDNRSEFMKIRELLASSSFLVQMGPTLALTRSRVLQWVPKQVTVEEADELNSCESTTDQHVVTAKTGHTAARNTLPMFNALSNSISSVSHEKEKVTSEKTPANIASPSSTRILPRVSTKTVLTNVVVAIPKIAGPTTKEGDPRVQVVNIERIGADVDHCTNTEAGSLNN